MCRLPSRRPTPLLVKESELPQQFAWRVKYATLGKARSTSVDVSDDI
jgi:hypothetical protein